MYMQSNEPFQRVSEGTSPMTAGLLTGLAAGAVAAGYQGLSYASYTGLDAKFDKGREKYKKEYTDGLKSDIKNTQSELDYATNRHKQLVKNQEEMKQKADKFAGKADNSRTKAESARSRATAELPRTGNAGVDFVDGVATEVRRVGAKPSEKIHTFNMNRHRSKQNKFERKAASAESMSSAFADSESRHRAHLESLQSKLSEGFKGDFSDSKWSDSKLNSEKEAHRWHGNNFKKSAMKSGAFALGGFVVGGGIQMAVNSLDN